MDVLSAREADQDPARDDEAGAEHETAADALGLAQEQGREPQSPERLGRHDRRHDAEPAAEERIVERDVRDHEQHH